MSYVTLPQQLVVIRLVLFTSSTLPVCTTSVSTLYTQVTSSSAVAEKPRCRSAWYIAYRYFCLMGMGQTDRRTDGRIAVAFNTPLHLWWRVISDDVTYPRH